MPILPAFCDTCYTAFPSGIVVENVKNLTISRVQSRPCPRCGGIGHVPDGVFNAIGNFIEVLSGPDRTVQELQRLATIIKDSRKNNETADQIKQKIEEDVPQLSPLMNLIVPKTAGDFYALLSVIIAIITSILSMIDSSSNGDKQQSNQVINNEVIYNEVINNIYANNSKNNIYVNNGQNNNQTIYTSPKPIMPNSNMTRKQPLRVQKIRRNEKCPCGSMKKFKHCHGRNSTSYVPFEGLQ